MENFWATQMWNADISSKAMPFAHHAHHFLINSQIINVSSLEHCSISSFLCDDKQHSEWLFAVHFLLHFFAWRITNMICMVKRNGRRKTLSNNDFENVKNYDKYQLCQQPSMRCTHLCSAIITKQDENS